MANLTFIVRLKRSFTAYEEEIEQAKRAPWPEYFRFLRALTFYAFIEEVVNACAMFPRSQAVSREMLEDLSFGIIQEYGIGRYHLSHLDRDRLRDLVMTCGNEVIDCLEGGRYYFEPHQLPRGKEDDPYFTSDLSAVTEVTKINDFTFRVEVHESHFDDLNDFPKNAVMAERLSNRSY
jgi:hypothetical protein